MVNRPTKPPICHQLTDGQDGFHNVSSPPYVHGTGGPMPFEVFLAALEHFVYLFGRGLVTNCNRTFGRCLEYCQQLICNPCLTGTRSTCQGEIYLTVGTNPTDVCIQSLLKLQRCTELAFIYHAIMKIVDNHTVSQPSACWNTNALTCAPTRYLGTIFPINFSIFADATIRCVVWSRYTYTRYTPPSRIFAFCSRYGTSSSFISPPIEECPDAVHFGYLEECELPTRARGVSVVATGRPSLSLYTNTSTFCPI